MTVYHGSNQIVSIPDISYSKNFLDFGKGFYVTTFQKQAEKWTINFVLLTKVHCLSC